MHFQINTSDEIFEKLVDEAVESIPSKFRAKLENVDIFIEDWPTRQQIINSGGRMLFGLYEGIPQTKRGRYGVGITLPDRITIFRRPIESVARTENDLKQLIKNTVWHEVAHHFGMDESSVRKAESIRKKRTNKNE